MYFHGIKRRPLKSAAWTKGRFNSEGRRLEEHERSNYWKEDVFVAVFMKIWQKIKCETVKKTQSDTLIGSLILLSKPP